MQKLHFIGIGGIGMSALAFIALQKGFAVSGSDLSTSPIIEKLKEEGASIYRGHDARIIKEDMTVVFTTDILKKNNPEFEKAKKLRIPLLHRSELLCRFFQGKKPLLVAGSHGKTTTTSLLSHVLASAGKDPAIAVGGVVASLKTNGKWGEGEYFVAEADESDGTFLKYSGFGAILTNIGGDHLSFWKAQEALHLGFKNFAKQISSKDHLFWCRDNAELMSANIEGVSYGFSKPAELLIENFEQKGWSLVFDLEFRGKRFEKIEVPLIGHHNGSNAASVFGLLIALGIPEDQIRKGFETFEGVGRRAEKKGIIHNIYVCDDYAHHPTEIETTLRGFRKASENRRLIVVFQPHRYTRTKECFEIFPKAFLEPDAVILTDIYSAGETPIEGISIHNLHKAIQAGREKPVYYSSSESLLSFLEDFVKPGDFVVTMGAGDITKMGPKLLEKLALRTV